MKVDTVVEKLPKDSGSVTRNDARIIAKEAVFDILNSNEDKLLKSKYNVDLLSEIKKVKDELNSSGGGAKDQKGKK
jgi:hypothetical protein